jgi:hypothetical protein
VEAAEEVQEAAAAVDLVEEEAESAVVEVALEALAAPQLWGPF